MLLRLFEQHSLCDRYPKLAEYQMLAQMGKLSQRFARGILIQTQDLVEHHKDFPNKLHRVPTQEQLYEEGDPDIIIGKLSEDENIPLGISLSDNMNCIFAGRSGSGKTTGIRNLMQEIFAHHESNVSVICFAFKGGDYADWPDRVESCIHLEFQKTLKIGLNAPEGVPPNVWINVISEVFAHRATLKASSVCFANMIRFLISALNPNPGQGPLRWPSFELILELANKVPLTVFATKPDYQKSLLQKLEGFVQATGELFQTFNGLDLDRDIVRKGKSVVLDLCGLAPQWVKAFATDILLLQLLLGRQFRYERGTQIDCLICLDEADQYVDQKAEAIFSDLSPISLFLKQGREFKLAVALGLSAIGPTARMILTNASHYYFFTMSDADSLYEANKTLHLPHGAEGILPSLKPGECLYRGPGPWPHAMLAKINHIPSSRVPRPAHFDQHKFVPSQHLDELPIVKTAIDKLMSKQRCAKLSQAKKARSRNTDCANKLLELIIKNPYKPTAYLWKEIGKVLPATQTSVRRQLENKALVKFAEVRISRRNLLLALPTDLAYEQFNEEPPKKKTRGDIEHSHYIDWIWRHGKQQGYKAKKEAIVPGTNHPVDVMWWVGDELYAFEAISKTEHNIINHLQACLIQSKEISVVTIVATQKCKLERIKKTVRQELSLGPFDHKIRYEVVEKYLEACWK